MAMPAREYLINADFDLGLRRAGAPLGEGLARQSRELARHFFTAGGPEHSLLLDEDPPEALLDYFEQRAVPHLSPLRPPALSAERVFTPFGWSAAAIEHNRRYAAPAPHPPLETVRRVNGRRFGYELERALGEAEHLVAYCREMAEIERALGGAGDVGVVLKAEHGNAGLANRRVAGRHLDESSRRWLERTLAEDGGVVVERWQERRLDLSVTFELSEGGALRELAVHTVLSTDAGAFLGALFGDAALSGSEREELERGAEAAGRALAEAGYFGPVCLDAYLYAEEGAPRLRPLVEINARRHVSSAAKALWESGGRDGVCYWRFFSPRRLTLPESPEELAGALGDADWDARRRRGTLLSSPLPVPGAGPQPFKISVLFVADDRAGCKALEARFLEACAR